MSVRSFAYDSEQKGRGKGAAQAVVTVACGSHNISGHSTVLQVQLEIFNGLRGITICSDITSHERVHVALMCSQQDYQWLQSRTVPSPVEKLCSLTNCSPLPSPIPLSECCMNFLSHAIAANKHRLVSGGRHSADQRYEIAKCETCQ